MGKALVILCGGDSSRMGSDKALLPFKDKCMVEYIYDKFSPYFDKIYLSVSERGSYTHLDIDIQEIPDIYRNAGPMGAILSSLTMITEDRAFFMSVDTPFMDPRIAIYLLEQSLNFDITSFKFKGEYLDVVCGVYNKHCLSALGKCIIAHNVTKSNVQSKCYSNLIDIEVINEISSVSFEQQFFRIVDRQSYYMAVFSVLKNNFIC